MEFATTLTGNEPIVITIGNFDGIHKGHQSLMHKVCDLAQQLESRPVFVTFQPHTLAVVRPEIDLQCLTTLEEKLALANAYGHIKDSIIIEFTTAVASLSATEFMDALCERFKLRGMVVGANFSLGHKRVGDVAFLQAYGKTHGIDVRSIELEEIGDQRITSTQIRRLVSEGDVAEARELLGHSMMIHGEVVRGDQRGRLLGFPTANIVPPAGKLIPANGVYAARVFVRKQSLQSDAFHSSRVSIDARIDHAETLEHWNVYYSAVNIGVRPTFQGQTRLIEAHLLDVEGLDLYDQCLSVHFIARLRSEQRFSGIEALKAQIAEDGRKARQILQEDGEK